MADQPLYVRSDADLEAALRGLADAIDWPTPGPAPAGGPDLATVVRSRIEAGDARRLGGPGATWRSWRPVRRVLVIAIVTLLSLAVLAAIAGAVGLGLPGLRLILGEPPVSPPPTLEPSRSPAAAPLGSRMGLGTPVALEDLDATAGFDVQWPSDPAIGPPDAAFVDDTLGGQVTLVWAARPGLPQTLEPGVGLVMSVFSGTLDSGFFTKAINSGTRVRLVLVNDSRAAYWLSGAPHFFFYESRTGQIHDPRRWVGDALLWADGPLTYRLETALGSERAIEIAESLP